jgi:sterol 14alpha-demethylase
LLGKLLDPSYFQFMKAMNSSLDRYVNTTAAQKLIALTTIQETHKSAVSWTIQGGHSGGTIEVFNVLSNLVHKILVRTLAGDDFYRGDCAELYDLFETAESDLDGLYGFRLPAWVPRSPARRLQTVRERMKKIFCDRLRQRESAVASESSANPEDYMTFMLKDKTTASFEGLLQSHHTHLIFKSHASIVSNIAWTIISVRQSRQIIAGHLAYNFELKLLRNPAIMKAIQREIRSYETAEQSALLQAAIKETNRCYAAAEITRLAARHAVIPGSSITVPKGTIVSVSPYLSHHDPANFPDPNTWLPQRWLGASGELMKLDTKVPGGIRFMPFGTDEPACAAETIANSIVTSTLSTILTEYDLSFTEISLRADFASLDFSKIGSPWLNGDVEVRIRKRVWPETMGGC